MKKFNGKNADYIIRELSNALSIEDCAVYAELCGYYIWLATSDSNQNITEILLDAGFKWHTAKMLWYLKPHWMTKPHIKPDDKLIPYDEIREIYGCEAIAV